MALRGRNSVFNRASRARAQAFADAREEVVNLNATPFASTIDSPSIDIPTPVTVMGSRAEPEFNMADWYTNYLGSSEYQKKWTDAREKYRKEAEDEEDAFSGEFRGYGAGTGGAGYAEKVSGTDMFAQKITDSGVSRSIDNPQPFDLDYEFDYDTSKLYMKTPDTGFGNTAMWSKFGDIDAEEKKRLETGRYIDISGGEAPVGSYSMVWIENPPEASTFEKVLSSPVISIASMINPVVGLATTAAKAASGMKVSPMEIASGLMTGLNMAGVTKPPSLDAMPAGQVGTPLPNKGTGLFNSTYGQTQTALNVAAAGDAQGAALSLLGPQAVKAAIDKVPDDRILNVLQKDDVQAGLTKVVERVADGAEFDEALAYGLGTYIKEGGGLNIEGTDVSLGVIEDVVRDIVRPIGKAGTALAKFVKKAMPDIDTSGLDPIEDAIRQAGRTTEDVVRAGGRAVDQAVIQPTREVAKAFDDAVIQPVGDAFSALDTAVRQALPSTSIDLPSLNIPNFNPNLGQFGLQFTRVSDTGEPATQPSSTRTTDALFGDELFKFKTPIEGTQERLDYIDLNSPFDQSQELELELTYPDSTEESDGFFEGTIYEQQPRSYNF